MHGIVTHAHTHTACNTASIPHHDWVQYVPRHMYVCDSHPRHAAPRRSGMAKIVIGRAPLRPGLPSGRCRPAPWAARGGCVLTRCVCPRVWCGKKYGVGVPRSTFGVHALPLWEAVPYGECGKAARVCAKARLRDGRVCVCLQREGGWGCCTLFIKCMHAFVCIWPRRECWSGWAISVISGSEVL